MPLDGVFLNRLTDELTSRIVGGRVDKIHQPAKESIVINMRAQAGNQRLLLSASASNPRIQLTQLPQDNPASPPMFCMLMRKHLTGARLAEVRQIGLDRVVHLLFETVNELGDRVTLTLAAEIMGRHSNVILVDQNGRVIDSIKRINEEMSRVRPILPGITYTLAPAPVRLDLRTAPPKDIWERLRNQSPGLPLDKALLAALEGMSPLVCREIAFQVLRGEDLPVSQLTDEHETRLKFFLSRMQDMLAARTDIPTMLLDKSGKPKDFSYLDIHQYGHTMAGRAFDSYSALLDSFYSERDRIDRMHQRGADLLRLLVNLSDRIARKLTAQREELRESTEREKWKVYGDLISSNMYTLQKGLSSARLANYYVDGMPEVEIPLDAMLTPAQNAQRYYTLYRKADTAEKKLRALIEQGEGEALYLDSVFDELSRVASEGELDAIRRELSGQGYLRNAVRKGMKPQKLPPLRFCSDDGFHIVCGRNNEQNERLTLKDCRNSDIWFHTQKIPGSHVIILTEGREVPNRTLEQAAIIAAYYSNGRDAGKVPVDYTRIKNIWKHPAGKPGLVLYDPYETAIVTPDAELVARLAEK